MKLLLWDIDGTLVWTGGAGERALTLSMRENFGIDVNMEEIDYSGRTDVMIARILFAYYKVERTDENVQRFLDGYLEHLAAELPKGDPEHTRVLPGIQKIVEAVHERDDLAQGLLTGNLPRGAETKLGFFELWSYFRFGAFADSHHDRNELSPVALARAEEVTGETFEPEDIWVIGDTPHDIECGKAIGANTLAVATGKHDYDELEEASPDYLVENLVNWKAFFEIIEVPN